MSLGLVVFVIGSALAALAGSAAQLIATRALMGVGGALIMPSTLSILTNVFTVPAERARAIAVWAGFSAMGIAVGPVLGGWLLSHFWWGAVFLVNLPVVAVALIGGRLVIAESRDPSAPPIDPAGAVLSIAGLASLLYAIIEAPGWGWTAPTTLVAFALAAFLLAAFVAWERRTPYPMLDVNFFTNPRFTAASLAVTLVFFALFGALFLLTQYLQFVLGYTALQAGTRVLPIALVLMVTAPVSARLVERAGTKAVVVAGLGLVAAGLAAMSQAVGVDTGFGGVLASLVILGIGMGLTMAPATESIMGSLPIHKAGVGSAVNDTTRQVGGALGVAILGSLSASSYVSSLTGSLKGANLPPALLAAARSSVGGAVAAAQQVGGDAGRSVALAARAAFVDGMASGVLVAAAVALAGSFIALVFLPAQAPAEPDIAPGLDELISVEGDA